jgi:predicted outer membrane lipoprotein
MQAAPSLLDRLLLAAAFALLLALSWPGVEAQAESDLAPSSRELTRLDAPGPVPAPPAAQGGASCAASDPRLVGDEYARQREMMQKLAQAMAAEGDGEFRALDGRGYGYFPERNPALELARLQREALLEQRAKAEAAK